MAKHNRLNEATVQKIIQLHQQKVNKDAIAKEIGSSPASVSRVIASFNGKLHSANPHINKLMYKITGKSGNERLMDYGRTSPASPPQRKDTQGLVGAVAGIETAVHDAIREITEMEETIVSVVRQLEQVKHALVEAKDRL